MRYSRSLIFIAVHRRSREKGSQMPCRVSSGAHEWINEGPTVPARDPVKPTEPVHRLASPRRERRPCGALPQPGVGLWALVRSVGGRRCGVPLGGRRAANETPPIRAWGPNPGKPGDSVRWAVRLGRHAREKITRAPKGRLRRVRTPP